MIASLAVLSMETIEQLQQKLLEQDKKRKEGEEKLIHKIKEEEKKMEEQEKRLSVLNDNNTQLSSGLCTTHLIVISVIIITHVYI